RLGNPLQQDVWEGLEPDHLTRRGRLQNPAWGRHHRWSPSRRPQRVEAAVGSDLEQPRPHGRSRRETRDAMPGGQERVLHRLLGILRRTQNAIAVNLKFPLIAVHEMAECFFVSGLRAGDEIAVHRGFLPTDVCSTWAILSPM